MGSVSFFILVVFVVLYQGPLPVIATNCSDPVMFVFGDSNSDTGGSSAAFGSLTDYPTGNIFPYPQSDRACDGRLVIDFLCENVTTSYLKAYLNSLEPTIGNGANFAMKGSTATFPTFSLSTQNFQLERYYNRSLELHSKGLGQNLVGEEGFKRALYVIDIGQNDLAKAFDNASYAGMIKRIHMITFAIKMAIKAIYEVVGGRRFWVHNIGPLGCLPSELSSKKPNANDLDQHGCIKYVNQATELYNKHLFILCEELRREMNDTTIVYVDMYAIKYDLIANASSYGFENPLTACLEYNLDGSFNLCAEQSKHISWDGTHYTDAANAFVASKIISSDYSTPPLPFNFFCGGSFT